ncbi:hypothetical protein H3H37_19975 [Duganella sp. LX20W]|uniref:Uncharacterized protein n=1 Tax=Rugamonas brunnea TaxID=2758569 RepID=A0A7W2IDF1_9BURK|nr:hypothetical protein [Rugamonas brunnea]MBA5639344.1 hypothetical protein [Rugamonas brunnea]
MRNSAFMARFGAALGLVFVAVYLWQTPGIITGKLAKPEIDTYLAAADKNLEMPDPALKQRVMQRLRAWAEADDGKPFYMLNLMRHFPKLVEPQGAAPLNMTPQAANTYYEDQAFKLLLPNAGSAPYGSDIRFKDALIPIGTDASFDHWSRMLLVRYPNRRAFLQLVSDPRYAPLEPYKLRALEVLLVPTDGDLVLPDLRLATGAVLLLAFLGMGWYRSARQSAVRHDGGN